MFVRPRSGRPACPVRNLMGATLPACRWSGPGVRRVQRLVQERGFSSGVASALTQHPAPESSENPLAPGGWVQAEVPAGHDRNGGSVHTKEEERGRGQPQT